MRLAALIFDVDGTLADTEEAHRQAFNEAFRQHGLDWQWSPPEYAQLLKTTGGKERLAAYVDSLALGELERRELLRCIPSLHESKSAIYARLLAESAVPLREGVPALLDAAQGAGVALAIASTTTLSNIEALLLKNLGAGALERFRVIGCGDQVARKKPAPDIYRFVLRSLGASPEECIAIEDSANGLKAAKAAGLFTVVTPCYWTQHEDFAAADVLLASLRSFDIGRPFYKIRQCG